MPSEMRPSVDDRMDKAIRRAGGYSEAIEEAYRDGAAAERARCAKLVAEMLNQRDAYRKILGDSAAQLPKNGHWAEPFFEEAERAALPEWAVQLAERAYLTPGSPVNAFAGALIEAVETARSHIFGLLHDLPEEVAERVADKSYVTTGDANDVALTLADEIEKLP